MRADRTRDVIRHHIVDKDLPIRIWNLREVSLSAGSLVVAQRIVFQERNIGDCRRRLLDLHHHIAVVGWVDRVLEATAGIERAGIAHKQRKDIIVAGCGCAGKIAA